MRLVLSMVLALWASHAAALEPREGWVVMPSPHDFDTLVDRVREAVSDAPINVVTQASASSGAANQGIEIPGNRVIGLYRNDYARRMLEASVAAGIEAPIRIYVTEEDGVGVLSWKEPSAVFAPYMDEGGAALADLAAELDAIFQGIADAAVTP